MMYSVDEPALFTTQGVNARGTAPGSFQGRKPCPFSTGETYLYGIDVHYQAGRALNLDAFYFPVNAKGELRRQGIIA
ncbi:hypothetical protein [uncultured Modestobacter sp.]|uniref:hypothetical protein n=1 Tax=uncultured Modestobacter sp. TaxID=380048 RepID=UPI0026274003|nr:hypothetical protein [uncultured Modestobacter sp.]